MKIVKKQFYIIVKGKTFKIQQVVTLFIQTIK